MPLYRWEVLRRRKPIITRKLHDVSQVLYLPFDKDHEPYSVESYDPTQVLRLPFEDPPQEITYDRSGYGNDGTIYGATRVIGKVRNALVFDGRDDYVEVPKNPTLDLDYFTLAAWIYPNAFGNWWVIFSDWDGSDARVNIFLRTDVGGALQCIFGDGTSVYSIAVSGALTLKTWQHVAATYDQVKLSIYRDGELLDSKAVTAVPYKSPQNLNIGRRPIYNDNFWNGLIDEVRIYNRGLTQAEVRRVMQLGGL